MGNPFKPTFIDRAICAVAPEAGFRRLAARKVLHEFRYDGALATSKRASAPHNMSPNSFDVQRDRLQLMREAEDMERNFAPAKMLNRKVSMYCSPISYHAQTGDHGLDSEVEDYLETEVFPNCDITQRYDFFRMIEFGIMGMNRGGDYGWAFQRPGLLPGMDEADAVKLPLRIQAIEPDRIGGVYQNVVSNDYVSGCLIGEYGEITHFRVFHRSMTTNVYDNPVDIPAENFVHMTDPMRIDQYRGVSVLATAIQNLRDLYEMIDFVKGKAKIASALTVFTNSNGAMAGAGAMDAYATNVFAGGQGGLQQDIQFGQINHLAGGTDIKFPSSNSPSSEEQALMTLLLKFVAMSYNLPYSFALDAAALGGVSSRLESEMAKAEFERLQRATSPHATRIKNTFLLDAVAKGVFLPKDAGRILRGRWGYRSHPQPDLGREASASVNLWQNGLLNPIKHWVDDAQDPEAVADAMGRWAAIKRDTAAKYGMEVQDIFGAGMAKPLSQTESTTESTTTDQAAKRFESAEKTLHTFAISDAALQRLVDEKRESIREKLHRRDMFEDDLKAAEKSGSSSLQNRASNAIVQIDRELADDNLALNELTQRQWRRQNQGKKPSKSEQQKASESPKDKEIRQSNRFKLRAVYLAICDANGLSETGSNPDAWATAYSIVRNGKYDESRIPERIIDKVKDSLSTTPEEIASYINNA